MTEADIYALAVDALNADQEAEDHKAAAADYQRRAKTAAERSASIRASIAEAMADGGFQEVTGPYAIVTYRRGGAPGVIVTDEAAIPASFMKTPPPPAPKPDTNAIKAALKAGENVPGAVLKNSAPTIAIKGLACHD